MHSALLELFLTTAQGNINHDPLNWLRGFAAVSLQQKIEIDSCVLPYVILFINHRKDVHTFSWCLYQLSIKHLSEFCCYKLYKLATCARHHAGSVFDPTGCHIAFRSGRANGSVPLGMSHDGTAGKSCLLLSLMNPTKVRLERAGLHSLLLRNEDASCNLMHFTRKKSFLKEQTVV